MRYRLFVATALISNALASNCLSQSASEKESPVRAQKAAKPDSPPGWISIDEDILFPLRFEPLRTLGNIAHSLRANEVKVAANEIDKAVSWIKLAECHAMPVTKEQLACAREVLEALAKDLRDGKIKGAAELERPLAKAAQALGVWHFYKATESYGKEDESTAGQHLILASTYLKHAADFARLESGVDETLDQSSTDEDSSFKSAALKHKEISENLQAVHEAIEELGKKMEAAGN